MILHNSQNSKTFSKAIFFGGALIATLLVGGCDKKEAATDANANTETTEVVTTSTTADTATTEVVSESSVATDTAPLADKDTTLAQLSSDTLNNMVFIPLIDSGELTDEQKTCLEARDKNLGMAESQAYFESKLTKEELDELNTFYSSDIGKKLLAYGNEQLKTLNGQEVSNPLPAPSEDEMAQMQAFMQSPTGQKYLALNNAEGEDSMYSALNPIIEAELQRCNIDLNQ